jgi:hypothetical protein
LCNNDCRVEPGESSRAKCATASLYVCNADAKRPMAVKWAIISPEGDGLFELSAILAAAESVHNMYHGNQKLIRMEAEEASALVR